MKFEGDFDENIDQLIRLLRKIIGKSIPHASNPEWAASCQGEQVNLNICFFNFPPEFSEALEGFPESDRDENESNPGEKAMEGDDMPRLSRTDLDFLKQNGIRF